MKNQFERQAPAWINQVIAANKLRNPQFDVGQIFDGYHTFSELYDQRNLLFIAWAKSLPHDQVWVFDANDDGTKYEGWFGLGVFPAAGFQISFHLPEKFRHLVKDFTRYDVNPEYDEHTSLDVIGRIQRELE